MRQVPQERDVVKMYTKPPDRMALYLFHQGTNYRAHDLLGAHLARRESVDGVVFCTWAPRAAAVGVIGDFNDWGVPFPLERITDQGLWQGFVPGLAQGDLYKFAICDAAGNLTHKCDPYATHGQTRGQTASIVWSVDGFEWRDQQWMAQRGAEHCHNRPLNIYEVHLGSWRRYVDGNYFSYDKLADELIPYVKRMGYTHMELLPVQEHPFDGSWGYQVTGFFSPTSRFGTPQGLMGFIDAAHRAGIGVILDWVPGHFPKDEHGLYRFDGDWLYEPQADWKREMQGWGTVQFDFGRCEVQSFLASCAVFWATKYHADGLRVDAVASMLYLDYDKKPGEWVPNTKGGRENLDAVALLRKINQAVHEATPDIMTIAEESTAWGKLTAPLEHDGLGFDFKWNMGWMNDLLDYIQIDPYFRSHKHTALTFPLTYAFSEHFILPISHDEVVHGKKSLLDKMPGTYEQKFAGLRMFYAYMLAHPGKKLHFMGAEFGQFIEWDEEKELDWLLLQWQHHHQARDFFAAANAAYGEQPALWRIDDSWAGFEWLECDDANANVIAFVRDDGRGERVLVVCNFSGAPHRPYTIGVPDAGQYTCILNTDAPAWGGEAEAPDLTATPTPHKGHPHSLEIALPPLCVQWYIAIPSEPDVIDLSQGG